MTGASRANIGDYYRLLAETAEDHIFVIDREDRVEYVNRAAARQHGVEPAQLIGRLRRELFPPEIAERQGKNLRQVFDSGEALYVEAPAVYAGRDVWLGTSLTPIRDDKGEVRAVLGVSRDMTARKRADEALRKLEAEAANLQRLEALGRLAGGIAHDFNNHLTSILGYVDLLMEQTESGSAMAADLAEVRHSTEAATGLVRRLLAFGRRQVVQPRSMDLAAAIVGLRPALAEQVGGRIRIEMQTADDLSAISGDPIEIEQIVTNLAANARDAMPDGGTLTIQALNVSAPAEHCAAMGEGPYVALRIGDTGAGMTPDVRERVFEPFFTTKQTGAGLGLSAVYAIVKQLNGFVWVESEAGRGSTFHIYLPAAAGPRPQAPPVAQPAAGARQTILLVEDEDSVRRFAKRALEHNGYRVIDVGTPEEALSYTDSSETLALLLTDVVMPRISGPEVAARLQQARPDLPVLFMSGYPSSLVLPDGSIDPSKHLIPKPFTTAELIQTVRELLGSRA